MAVFTVTARNIVGRAIYGLGAALCRFAGRWDAGTDEYEHRRKSGTGAGAVRCQQRGRHRTFGGVPGAGADVGASYSPYCLDCGRLPSVTHFFDDGSTDA